MLYGLLFSFDKKEYSFYDIIWLTAPFNISETSIRTILSRMVGNNMLSVRKFGKNAFYSLTSKSKNISSNVAMGFKKPDWSEWDNDWWGISMSLPMEAKKERYRINKKIAKHRFALLHPGFWIRPYHENENMEKRLEDILNNKNVKTIRFKFYKEEELLKIPAIWNIKEINNEFKKCNKLIEKAQHKYDLENPKESLIGKMAIGNIIVPVLFKDPLLPERFLPKDWQGDFLRNRFIEWDKITTEKSKPYWEKIFHKQ